MTNRAYVQAIRNAKHFILIENQYFMGSSYSWTVHREVSIPHTIPREIVDKVVSMIEAGRRFTVYVTIPMFPEGDPTSMASQEILYWQRCTMEAMYFRNVIVIGGLNQTHFFIIRVRKMRPMTVTFTELAMQ